MPVCPNGVRVVRLTVKGWFIKVPVVCFCRMQGCVLEGYRCSEVVIRHTGFALPPLPEPPHN